MREKAINKLWLIVIASSILYGCSSPESDGRRVARLFINYENAVIEYRKNAFAEIIRNFNNYNFTTRLEVREKIQGIYGRAITANEIAANTITAQQIRAGTITALELATNSVTAQQINVGQLSAITADMGELTAGILRGIDIFGSRYLNRDGSAHLRVGTDGAGSWADFGLFTGAGTRTFHIWDGGDHIALYNRAFRILSHSLVTQQTHPAGAWNFAGATVTGLPATPTVGWSGSQVVNAGTPQERTLVFSNGLCTNNF